MRIAYKISYTQQITLKALSYFVVFNKLEFKYIETCNLEEKDIQTLKNLNLNARA